MSTPISHQKTTCCFRFTYCRPNRRRRSGRTVCSRSFCARLPRLRDTATKLRRRVGPPGEDWIEARFSFGERPDLAEIGAVRDRTADRIDCRIADDQIEVGAVRAEGVV